MTEHINPGQSWTDIWAVTPGSNQPPTPLLQDVQVQGPFDFSPDGQQLLFSSPRNGNFDIYVATLDAAGKDALKKLSSDTELAPALAAAGHPAGLSTTGQASRPRRPRPRRASCAAPRPGVTLPAGAQRAVAVGRRAERVDQRNRYPASRYQPVRSGARRPGRRLGAGRGRDDRPQAKQKEGHTI